MSPSFLETELSTEVNETKGLFAQEDLLHPNEVVVVLDLVFNTFLGLFYAVYKGGCVVDYLKLPVSGQVMGSTEYAALDGIFRTDEVIFKSGFKVLISQAVQVRV